MRFDKSPACVISSCADSALLAFTSSCGAPSSERQNAWIGSRSSRTKSSLLFVMFSSMPGSPALQLVQRFFQLAFEIADVEADSARAVEDRDTNHDEVERFLGRRLVGMLVKIVIDALLEREEVAQADDRRQFFHRTAIRRRRLEGDPAGVDERDLPAVFEQKNKISILGLGMDLFLEPLQVAPRHA